MFIVGEDSLGLRSARRTQTLVSAKAAMSLIFLLHLKFNYHQMYWWGFGVLGVLVRSAEWSGQR